MIRGVIFDVDGTLLDSMPIWEHAGERYLKSQGKIAEAGLKERLFPMSLEESAAYLKERYLPGQSLQEIKEGIDTVISGFYKNEVLLKPGADRFLKALRGKKIPLAAATSGSRELTEAAFDRLGIRGCFKQILTCTEVGKSKKEPDIFLAAAEAIQAAPDEIWVFEDALHAIRTAARAGFCTVGVFDEADKEHIKQMQDTADLFLYDLNEFEVFWEQACDTGIEKRRENEKAYENSIDNRRK